MKVVFTIDVINMDEAAMVITELQNYMAENNYPDEDVYVSVSDNEYDHSAGVCNTCSCPPSQHIKNVPGTSNGKPYCMYHQRQCHDNKVVSGH